jgi:hypothetical protein
VTSPRAVARELAAGRGEGTTLVVPLALHVSARIQERDAEDFVYDATQLANALRDLIDAVQPDGVQLSEPEVLLAGCRTVADVLSSPQLAAAVEAARRLRASHGDAIALVTVLPGPATLARRTGARGAEGADAVLALGREFLAAGADVIVVDDQAEEPDPAAPEPPLSTLANVARFHQALALSHGASRYGLPAAVAVDLHSPTSVQGVAVTGRALARDTDITVLRDWVLAVRR